MNKLAAWWNKFREIQALRARKRELEEKLSVMMMNHRAIPEEMMLVSDELRSIYARLQELTSR